MSVDNLGVHKAAKASRWRAAHSDDIALFALPALRAGAQSRRVPQQSLEAEATEHAAAGQTWELVRDTTLVLRSHQRQPDGIKAHFRHKDIRYDA